MSWTNLNPEVKIHKTCKRFFNQYLYKAVVNLPAARLIQDQSTTDVDQLLAVRKNVVGYESKIYGNIKGGWARLRMLAKIQELEKADCNNLQYYRSCLQNNSTNRYRIEEPLLTIYSIDEPTLMNLIANSPNPATLISVYRPENQASITALNQGSVIVKKLNGYKYKIYLREGRFSEINYRSILSVLDAANDDVKLTKGLKINLTHKQLWFPGGYFYAKDLKILTLINLIDARAVSSFFELTTVDE